MHTLDRKVGGILLALLAAGSAYAQHTPDDDDLRAGNVHRRTALVSEEVARQRLVAFGLKALSPLRQAKGQYLVSVEVEGRPIEVEIDLQSGVIRERGKVLVLEPSARAAVPMVRDYSSKFSREEIARVPVVIEPLAPERPEAVRPLGGEPVKERPDGATEDPTPPRQKS